MPVYDVARTGTVCWLWLQENNVTKVTMLPLGTSAAYNNQSSSAYNKQSSAYHTSSQAEAYTRQLSQLILSLF